MNRNVVVYTSLSVLPTGLFLLALKHMNFIKKNNKNLLLILFYFILFYLLHSQLACNEMQASARNAVICISLSVLPTGLFLLALKHMIFLFDIFLY